MAAPPGNQHASKKTPETIAALIDAVASGMPFYTAAELVKINRHTITEWMASDEEFRLAMLQARAKARELAINTVVGAGRSEWQPALEFLARTDPEHWNPKLQLEHAGPGGGPIETVAKVIVMPAITDPNALRDDAGTPHHPDAAPAPVPREPG